MAEDVAKLCRVLPIKHVAERFGLDWHTVKAIDKAWLEGTLPKLDMTGVSKLLLDEFAIHKGHRYATVITDADTLRVLWVGHGRGQEAVRPFFQAIGKEACQRILAVGMDMHAPFETEVRRNCPRAEIVYDLFHVVMKYGREVIDRVRVDEANRLKADKAARKIVKGSKWLLLANRENLTNPGQRVRLKELLNANQALMTVYLLRDDLKRLWTYAREGWARRAWEDWLERAMESGIPALKTFARNLAKRIEGVLAHCRWDLNTSVLEGMNNKIKVLKRMAYGYRDDDYVSDQAPAQTPRFRVDYVETGRGASFSPEAGKDNDDRAFVVFGGEVHQMHLFRKGLAPKKVPSPLPGKVWETGHLKFRNGRFFARNGHTISEFDPLEKKWAPVLVLPQAFVQFEVNWLNQILILQPGGPLSLKDAKAPEKAFLEIWEKGASSPSRKIPYETEEQKLHLSVQGLPGFSRSWVLGEWLLLYNPYSGRMYAFGGEAQNLARVETPWKGLSTEVIETWEARMGTRFPRTQPVPIEFIDSPADRLGIVPTAAGTYLLFSRKFAPTGWNEKQREALATAGRPAPQEASFELPEAEADASRSVFKAELDLERKRVKITESLSQAPSTGVLWVDEKGDIVGFETFYSRLLASLPKKEAEPSSKKDGGAVKKPDPLSPGVPKVPPGEKPTTAPR